MTRVSVIVPVYNHAAYVGEAVRSVDGQDHQDLEIVAIDDGSTDGSAAAIVDLSRSVRHEMLPLAQPNRGAHAALNRGIGISTGDLVMFLNSDDRYLPRRVTTFVRTWERAGRPAMFWGFSSVAFIDDDGDAVDPAERGMGRLSEYNHHATMAAWVPELLHWHNVSLTSGNLVVTRELLDRVGGFSDLSHVHDWDMVLRLLREVRPVVIPLPLYEYRLHGSNTFSSISVEQSDSESHEVRSANAAAALARMTELPYSQAGTPFVDHLRAAVPFRAAFSGT
jgi:glycosyltransferase involved in cell wall biosynthesis